MPKPLTRIRWGIIGCGDVTEVKSGPAFGKCEGSELVAVMRRARTQAADYARRPGVARWYDAAPALVADPDVDAVYVAPPPASPPNTARFVAATGKPVYVEKPMARSTAECEAMLAGCEAAGVPLYVAYYRRRLPVFLRVKELLDEGAIGTVRTATVTTYQAPSPTEKDPATRPWRVNPEVAGGGHFFDLGCHQLDLLDFFLGPIEAVSGQALNQGGWYPAEDVVSAIFRFATTLS